MLHAPLSELCLYGLINLLRKSMQQGLFLFNPHFIIEEIRDRDVTSVVQSDTVGDEAGIQNPAI